MRHITVALILSIVALVGCEEEDEKFADAPAVAAPASPQTKGGPVSDDDPLPPSHPPIGSEGASPAAPSGKVTPPGGARAQFASLEEYGDTGPLRWEAPESWKPAKPATNFRIAEYNVPGPDGPANLGVFHFPGGGGGISANIDRWVGQFTTPEGQPAASTATRDSLQVSGMTVYLVDVSGTYNPGMAGSGPPQKNYRMRAVIVETDVGPFFFKLVGPKGTVDEQVEEFDAFVKSFEPAT